MDKPTTDEFKAFFSRDFPFQPIVVPPDVVEPDKYVQDSDVTKAFLMTDLKFNEEFFGTQEEYTMGYLYLAAHTLAVNLRNSNSGYNSSFAWASTSQSVGSVSVSSAVPDSIQKNPLYAWLVSTNYGLEYLLIILPNLVAPFGIAPGRTLA